MAQNTLRQIDLATTLQRAELRQLCGDCLLSRGHSLPHAVIRMTSRDHSARSLCYSGKSVQASFEPTSRLKSPRAGLRQGSASTAAAASAASGEKYANTSHCNRPSDSCRMNMAALRVFDSSPYIERNTVSRCASDSAASIASPRFLRNQVLTLCAVVGFEIEVNRLATEHTEGHRKECHLF